MTKEDRIVEIVSELKLEEEADFMDWAKYRRLTKELNELLQKEDDNSAPRS